MSDPGCIVAVDVGNSAIKLAVQREQSVVTHAIRHAAAGWEHAAVQWVSEQSGCRSPQWRVASVHRSAADRLIEAVRHAAGDTVIERITYRDVPMRLRVDHPERTGIDRILGAYAAANRQRGPLVVVDAGSAVTVDFVDAEGQFCGGAILPGLSLQARALATGTDALPQIQWDIDRPVRLPATNTADAIHAGILIGLAASIDRLAQWYLETDRTIVGHPASLMMTGGDATSLAPHLRQPHQLMPNLVCRGLLDLPRSVVGPSAWSRPAAPPRP